MNVFVDLSILSVFICACVYVYLMYKLYIYI